LRDNETQTSGASRRENADVYPLFEIRIETLDPSFLGAKQRSNPFFLYAARWIASRSLSSGAHSRDPLARNDD
jgi:hypothetical protein